jgi:hypothetical protein
MTEEEWLASEDPARMLTKIVRDGVSRRASEPGGAVDWASERKLRLFACALMWTEGAGPDNENEPHDPADWLRSYFRDHGPTVADVPKNAAALLRDIVGNPFRHQPYFRDPNGRLYDSRVTVGTGEVPWITPTVLSLARAAYEERPGLGCGRCRPGSIPLKGCPDCHGTGRVGDGTLDPLTLAALADALEEAGCAGERCARCHGSGTYTVQVRNSWLSAANGYGAATTYSEWRGCRSCGGDCDRKGSGRLPHPILAHLRSPGPHVRGCWALDLILGKS